MKFKRVCAAIAAALLVSTVGFSLSGCGDPSDLYVQAHADLRNGLYSEAGAKFISLGDYMSAPEMVIKTYNIYQYYYSVNSYDIGELSNGSKIDPAGGKHSRYGVNCRVEDSWKEEACPKISYVRYDATYPYSQDGHWSSWEAADISCDKIMDDGSLMVMWGFRDYFDLVVSPSKPEKEKLYLVVHEDYIIEKSTIFNGKINQPHSEETFDAEFNRDSEKYVFNKDGTFFYSGKDYAEQEIAEFYIPPKTDFNGTYKREGDFIFLEYDGKTRGLLIYNDTIVDRCMLSSEFML